MIFKVKGIDKVTERLADLMVSIVVVLVTTSMIEYLFGFKALGFSNWVKRTVLTDLKMVMYLSPCGALRCPIP